MTLAILRPCAWREYPTFGAPRSRRNSSRRPTFRLIFSENDLMPRNSPRFLPLDSSRQAIVVYDSRPSRPARAPLESLAVGGDPRAENPPSRAAIRYPGRWYGFQSPKNFRRHPRHFEGLQVSAAVEPQHLVPPPTVPEPIQPGAATWRQRPCSMMSQPSPWATARDPRGRPQAAAARAARFRPACIRIPRWGPPRPSWRAINRSTTPTSFRTSSPENNIGLDSAAAGAGPEAELSAVRTRFEVMTTVRQRFYTALVAEQQRRECSTAWSASRNFARHRRATTEGRNRHRGDVLLLQIEASRAEPSCATPSRWPKPRNVSWRRPPACTTCRSSGSRAT